MPVTQGQSCTPRVSAPSTTRLVPLTRLAAGLARKTTGAATSSGVPMWPVGFRPTAISKRSGLPVSMLCPDAALEVGVARRDGVGANVLVGQLERQTVDVADDRGLRGAVRTGGEVGLASGDTGDRDDRGGVAALEMWQRGSDEADGVHEVDVETGLPVLLGVGDRESADVGHDDVEAAEGLGRPLDPRREGVAVAHVDDRPGDAAAVLQRSFVAATSSASRAQKPTTAPSSRKASTMARPMPRVPPVTRTRLPVSCRSMVLAFR